MWLKYLSRTDDLSRMKTVYFKGSVLLYPTLSSVLSSGSILVSIGNQNYGLRGLAKNRYFSYYIRTAQFCIRNDRFGPSAQRIAARKCIVSAEQI